MKHWHRHQHQHLGDARRLDRQECQKRLLVAAAWAATVSFLVASLHPLDRAVDETLPLGFAASYGWIASQALCLLLPVVSIAVAACRWKPRPALLGGYTVLMSVPICLILDCIVFHWIGLRFLSETTMQVLWTLLPGLVTYVSAGNVLLLLVTLLAFAAIGWTGWTLGRFAAGRWSLTHDKAVLPHHLLVIAAVLAGLLGLPAMRNWPAIKAQMADYSTRHPLCGLRIVGYRSVGKAAATGGAATLPRLHGLALADRVRLRERQVPLQQVDATPMESQRPDVLLIIMESLRSELLHSGVMPNTVALAEKGMRLNQHFSGGNSSSLGIFSLVSGLESVWFDRTAIRQQPAMNALFRQAGYELGFFGGHLDWKTFKMDAFISDRHYDTFQIEKCDWLRTDGRAVTRAADFLGDRRSGKPRLAVLFLYSSHAPFEVDPRYALDEPYASSNYVTPYTWKQRPAIWNRYRNAVRSLDAMIAPLLTSDRLIVVTGDHGESFLDDGTVGHGTRLSRFQNQTLGVIAGPGIPRQDIEYRTMHADVLPTLLSAANLAVTRPDLIDGRDLLSVSGDELMQRDIATAHYIGVEMLLPVKLASTNQNVFGHRCSFSLSKWRVAPLNVVDDRGLELDSKPELDSQKALSRWLMSRFGRDPTTENRELEEWFRLAFASETASDRIEAVDIARQVDDAPVWLIKMLQERLHDDDADVARDARQALIKLKIR